ncbi:MAG TPA: hypothetical protein VLX28_26465 [Thermoanaerobaculia bacterium]|nr:hypothetical protein [Thermoanaerobaculia bacterium]
MNRTSSVLAVLVGVALAVVGPRGLAAQLAPLGPEAQLPDGDTPERPMLSVQPGGGYTVAWDDLAGNVFSHFVAAGDEAPGEGTNLVGGGLAVTDSVTATPKGFEVLWHAVNAGGEPVAFYRRHLDPRGVPAPGKPVLLARNGVDRVWALGGTRYLAGWFMDPKQAIGARLLSPFGQPAGPVFRLSSRPVDDPIAEVVPLADGGFVAVWFGTRLTKEGQEIEGGKEDENGTSVLRARRFKASGQPLGPDFDINTTPPGPGETAPFLSPQFQVAAAPGGGFAVSWALGQTIYLRYFDAAGRAVTPEIPAVSDPSLFAPVSMAFDDKENLLLLWLQFLDDPDLQIQRFDPHGAPLGPSQRLPSAASDELLRPLEGSVAWAGDSWLVTWAAGASDGSSRGVFVRRFARE